MDLGEFNDGTGQFLDRLNKYQDSSLATARASEHRMLAEQLYMDMVEPQAKMLGMKAAGINPLHAASGISQSATSTPQTTGKDAFSIAGDALAAAAGAGSDVANAYKEATLTEPTKQNLVADTQNKFSSSAFTDEQRKGIETDNKYRDEHHIADLNLKALNSENFAHEWSVMQSTYDLNVRNMQKVLKDIELEEAEIGRVQADTKRLNAEGDLLKYQADFAEQRIIFWKNRGFDILSSSTDAIFVQKLESGKFSQEDFQEVYNFYENRSKAESLGYNAGVDQYAYSIANAQETAKSLNQIVTDWNAPSSGLWSMLEKSFNISGNRGSKNNIGSALVAKDNPSTYSAYCQFLVGLNLSLSDIEEQIAAAADRKEFSKVRDLTKQKAGLEKFIRELTFDSYQSHMSRSE